MDLVAVAVTLMAATAAVSITCAAILMTRRHLVGAESLALASAAVGLWAGCYAAELAAGDLSGFFLWGDLKYVGIVLLPPAWIVFALRFTGRGDRVTPGLLLGLGVHPAAMLGLLAVPATHDLVRTLPVEVAAGGIREASVGPLFWIHAAYVTLVLAAATVIIIRSLAAVSRRYLPQSLVLAGAALLPWVANLVYNLPMLSWTVDLTPTAYAVMQVAFLWGVSRFKLFNVVPIAREIVLDSLDDAVVVLDAYGRITDINAPGQHLFGVPRELAFGRIVDELLPDRPGLLDLHDEHTRQPMVLARHEDRQLRDYEARVLPVLSGTTRIPGHMVILRDVTDLQEAQRRLEHLVHYDQLTALPNRSLYAERVERALLQSVRESRHTGVLFLDLDGFKGVNDTHGHEVGDAVLVAAAERMVATLRDTDTAIRFGGDEFLIVLPALRDEPAAGEVARKLLHALRTPYDVAGTRIRLSASIGIAVAPPNRADGDLLRRAADRAMYDAKAHGKDRLAYAHAAPAGDGEVIVVRDLAGARAVQQWGP